MRLLSEDIRKKLCEIYGEVMNRQIEIGEFESGIDLLERFQIDSLIALQIIVRVEQVFGVVIEDDSFAIEMLKSVDKAVEFISGEQNEEKLLNLMG